MNIPCNPRLAVLATAVSLFPAMMLAQSPALNSSDDESVFALSPFEVTTESDVGYVATNSLAGSRLNTPLRDTGASISVMTKELLEDLAAVSLEDAMAYANNVQSDMNDDTAVGSSPNDNSTFEFFTNFRVRGVKATVTRNYFPWRMPNDSYNIDRIEEQRGPNSILFGIGSAGGIINTMTKKASLGRDFIKGSALTGSYGRIRGTIDVNQSVWDDRLAIRFNAALDQGDGYREHVHLESNRAHIAAVWRIIPTMTLRTEWEKGKTDEVVARTINILDGFSDWFAAGEPTTISAPSVVSYSGTRQVYNTAVGQIYNVIGDLHSNQVDGRNNAIVDPAIASPTINTGGPSQLRTGDFSTYSAYLEKQFGRRSFLEVAYNHQENDQVSNVLAIGASDGATLYVDLEPTLPDGSVNPGFKQLYVDGQYGRMVSEANSDNIRASFSTQFDFGKWGDYRLAVMVEREERFFQQDQQRENYLKDGVNGPQAAFGSANNPVNSSNRVYRRANFIQGDWSSYWVPGPAVTGLIQPTVVGGTSIYSGFVNQNAGAESPEEQVTALIGGQARYWDGRVVLGFGLRKDKLDFDTYPEIRNTSGVGIYQELVRDHANPQHFEYEGITRTLGVVGHFTNNVTAFYNYSTNFSLPNTTIRVLPDSAPADNPEGQGTDMGFMFDLAEGKLSARLTYFATDIVNGHDFRFGGNANNPTVFARDILDALVADGQITELEADAGRVNSNGATFTRRVEGYELGLTANPTRNWRLSLNYSITDGFETNIAPEVMQWFSEFQDYLTPFDTTVLTTRNDQTIDETLEEFRGEIDDALGLDGRALPGNRQNKVTLFTRYSFREGMLKGFFVGGGMQHYSKLVAGVGGDGEIQYGNSYSETDFLLGYEFKKLAFFRDLKVQLNVNNLLDDTDPIVTRFRDDGEVWRYKIREPRSFRISANFTF